MLGDVNDQITSFLKSIFNKHKMVILAHTEEKFLPEVEGKLAAFIDNVRHQF